MVNVSTVVHLQRRARRNALHASLRLRQRRLEGLAATRALSETAPTDGRASHAGGMSVGTER